MPHGWYGSITFVFYRAEATRLVDFMTERGFLQLLNRLVDPGRG